MKRTECSNVGGESLRCSWRPLGNYAPAVAQTGEA
jgi:hypothetical protein